MQVFLSEAEIKKQVDRLAAEIVAAAGERPLLLIGILKGCFVFFADLCRAIGVRGKELETDFVDFVSYSGTKSTGEVKCLLEPKADFKGKYVVVVDTVYETGKTLALAKRFCELRGAEAYDFCVLLDKKILRRENLPDARFTGVTAGTEFLVGYGCDCNQRYRELPYVALLQEEER